ncbi:unnamed protein product [Onchocerca ochengi]|uniref:HELP domain-containing protein n=1 Tax=Onchocerca ochengi TaxID=42157 RepID=A0A182EGN8_ONCOC|nr:unnamed protein product [Onchocerca ochengi]
MLNNMDGSSSIDNDDDDDDDDDNDDDNDGILWNRIVDLENQIQSQEEELMCLRSTAAETLRRLNDLEQKSLLTTTATTTTTTTSSIPAMRTATARSSPPSRILQLTPTSAHNLHSTTSKNRLINGHTVCPTDENDNQTVSNGTVSNGKHFSVQTNSRLGRNIRRNTEKFDQHNQEMDVKSPATMLRMKKWLSSADVKCRKAGRRISQERLMKNSKIGTSAANLSHCKSTSKLGPTNSLNSSQYSLSRFGLELREPSFLCEKGVLQVFVNGKSVHLPVPNTITGLDLTHELDAPTCEPTLNWVYGYRGKDCRGNLHELPTGEIVYFTGTIVVLHNPNEGLQRYYTKHTSDIKCMAIHPNKLHIATGQTSRRFLEKSSFNIHRSPISSITELNNILETDQYKAHVRIWDSVTLQTLRTIGTGDASANFDRGVQCCAFSRAACMQLAIIDDSYEHILSIWDWQKGKKIAETKESF